MFKIKLISGGARVELAAGIGVLIAALINFCQITIIPLIQRPEMFIEIFPLSIIFLILPALLTAFGAYYHSIKQSMTGFILVIIGSGFFTLFYGILLITGTMFYGSSFFTVIIAILQFFLAATCLILAFIQNRKTYSQNNPLP